MATSASISILCYSSMRSWRLYSVKQLKGSVNFLVGKRSNISISSQRPSFAIRLCREEKEQISLAESNGSLTIQEDLNYMLRLGAGSFVGAAMIKYGSIIFPDITKPSILQALIMIFAPVVVAVWLLIKKSMDDSR